MPRLYAPVEGHTMDFGAVDFINGVAAVPFGASVVYFAAKGYTADPSKHALTVLDKLTTAQLVDICVYLGLAVVKTVGEDPAVPKTKLELTRAIEGYVSTANLAAIAVTSAAGTEVGDTKITTDPTTAPLRYKVGATAPAPLYMDDVSDWAAIESGDDITAATGTHITVVRTSAAGLVLASGTDEVTAKAAG